MASIPPQQSARSISPTSQRQYPSEASSQDEHFAPSMVSEDSQTILLDNPTPATKDENSTETSEPRRPPAPSRSSTFGVKKCWICICDSTEDDPAHPPKWRSPCTCNLTAHEACLLDWVADLENPRGRPGGGPPKKIQCPQCKTEIKIARPRSLVLSGVKAWERLTGTLTLPGMAGVLGTTIWAGCFYHGVHSVRVIFGEREAMEMFARANRHWGWLSAYALIPISLIAARTQYADFVLPGSTIFLFATQLSEKFAIDWTIWPPRPSTVFGCLPVVRNCYNYLYEKAFGNLNKKWLQEIRPRHGQDGEGNEADPANDAAAAVDDIADGDVVLELNLEIGVQDEEDDDEEQPEEQQQQQGARPDRQPENREAQPPARDQAANNNNNPPAPANPAPAPRPAPALLNRRPNEILTDTSAAFLSTLGALLFPSIAAGMGELLHHSLPLSWVKASSSSSPFSSFFSSFPVFRNSGREQLLRTRWGRSVVGGCLFVVLKDALLLYVRWRMARNHRGRRIMDFDRTSKEYVLRD